MCAPLKRFSEIAEQTETKVAKIGCHGRMLEFDLIVQPIFVGLAKLGLMVWDKQKSITIKSYFDNSQIEQALGNLLATISNDGQPPQPCSLENLKPTVDRIIQTKIGKFLLEVELRHIAIKEDSEEFPLYENEEDGGFAQDAIWEVLHDFIKDRRPFADLLKNELHQFCKRLILEETDKFISYLKADILKKISALNFFENEFLLGLIFQLIDTMIYNFQSISKRDNQTLDAIYSLCNMALALCDNKKVTDFLKKRFNSHNIEWLKENCIVSPDIKKTYLCENLLKLLEPDVVRQPEWIMKLKDGLYSLSPAEVSWLTSYSFFLSKAYLRSKATKEPYDLTELNFDSDDIKLFLNFCPFFGRDQQKVIQDDRNPFQGKDLTLADKYARIKLFLNKAQKIDCRYNDIFRMLYDLIPKSPLDIVNFLKIQEEVTNFNTSLRLSGWLKLRDEYLSEALMYSLTDLSFPPEDYLNAIIEVTSKYSAPEQEWMHIRSIIIPKGVFPPQMLAQLSKLKLLIISEQKERTPKYPNPNLESFPSLTVFQTNCIAPEELTPSNSLETFGIDFNYFESYAGFHAHLSRLFPKIKEVVPYTTDFFSSLNLD